MNETLPEQLQQLHLQNQPHEQFATALEEKLRLQHLSQQNRETRSQADQLKWRMKRLATMVACLILTVILIVTIAPIRTFAVQLFGSLFTRASSDEMMISNQFPETSIPEAESVSLETLETLVDFEIQVPTYIPAGYELVENSYNSERHSISLLYESPGRVIIITQQALAGIGEGLLTDGSLGVGSSAPITQINIGDVVGEYVEGTWIVSESSGDDANESATSEVYWNPTASNRSLRWSEDEMIYQIIAMGGSEGHQFVGQQEMVKIAQSME